MNERIFTELYKKVWGHFPCPTGEPELKKFALLIVRECGSIYEKIDNGSKHLGTDDYLEALCKHFGVKHFGVEE